MFSLTLRSITEAELPNAARWTCGQTPGRAEAAAHPYRLGQVGPVVSLAMQMHARTGAGERAILGGNQDCILDPSFKNPEAHP